MALRPCPVDANNRRLIDRGTQWGGGLRSLDTNWYIIQFPFDIKGVTIVVNEGTVYYDGMLDVNKSWFDIDSITDNGDGTVTIPCAAHGFADGIDITIGGTDYLDGTYEVLAAGDADNLVIEPDKQVFTLDAAAAVDNGDGTVTLAATDSPFLVGDTVVIAGTTNYNGSEVLQTGSDADGLIITAAYVAETLDGTETATGFVQESFTANTGYAVGRTYPYAEAGVNIELPIALEAHTTICSLKAASTAIVSLFPWR